MGIGGRPRTGAGQCGASSRRIARHGTTRSNSAKNCSRRVVFFFPAHAKPATVCYSLTAHAPIRIARKFLTVFRPRRKINKSECT